jgi:hypothetical protein
MNSYTTKEGDLSEAGLVSNLDYWKNVAKRYKDERDTAMREVWRLQKELVKRTGRGYDGLDYLREIIKTRRDAGPWQRIKNFFRGYL